MKRILSLLLAGILLLTLGAVPAAAAQYPLIYDEAQLLTQEEREDLETRARGLSSQYEALILTVEDFENLGHGDDPVEALSRCTEELLLDTDEDRDGIILMISMETREYALWSFGDANRRLSRTNGLDRLTEYFLEPLSEERWNEAFSQYLQGCQMLFDEFSAPIPIPGDPVTDHAGILTQEQEQSLTALSLQASEAVGCGFYILTLEDYLDLPYSGHIETVLKDLYLDNSYGVGPERSGIILMLSMADRDYALYTNGFGDSGLSDFAKDALVERFLDDFGDDLWYDGFKDYITYGQEYLQMSLDGKPLDENTVTPGIRMLGIGLSVLLAWLIAALVKGYFVRQMKSVHQSTEADHFISREGLQLSRKEDHYTHTTTTRVYDPPSESSGGSDSSSGSSSGSSRSGKF